MAVTVRPDAMTSDRTVHTARPAPDDEHIWEVSWLPGRYLTRNQAITAMVIADAGAPGDSFLAEAAVHAGHRAWAHLQEWAAQFGLTGSQALARVAAPPAWAVTRERPGKPADPEAAE